MRRPPSAITFYKYPVTAGTILLAIAVTLAWWGKVDISPALENVQIRRGELWRLLTSALPHAGILHLVFNAYWIWAFGTLVEEIYGPWKTFGIFLLLAAAANGAEYALLDGGVGLSGVGYGLFAMIWALSSRDQRFAGAVDSQTALLFVGWFFFCIFLTSAGTPIANVAHCAGAVFGALLGWTVSASGGRRVGLVAVMGAVFVAILLGDTLGRPWINLAKDRGDEEASLGYDDLMANRNDEAAKWLRDATIMNSHNAGTWFNLGIAYGRLARPEDALSAYRRAVVLEPDNSTYKDAAAR